jgi:hypothetical protein
MATLYAGRVPAVRYRALEEQARRNGRSISSKLRELPTQADLTDFQLARVREPYPRATGSDTRPPLAPGQFPNAAEEICEDRGR